MSRAGSVSAITALACVGCHDGETCGPGSASSTGLVVAGTGFTMMYGGFAAMRNNDCPDNSAPPNVVRASLTLPGAQVGASSEALTLCISRPDLLGASPLAIGLPPIDSTTKVELAAAYGSANGCTFALDPSVAPTGTVTATGVCDLGSNAAGFAITVSATLQLARTCGTTMDAVAATISGTVAVAE